MSEPIAEVTELDDVKEFITDELGHEVEESFLEPEDEQVEEDAEEQAYEVSEEAPAVEPEPPVALPPVSEATRHWQDRQTRRAENTQISELQAEVAALRNQQQVQRQVQQQTQQAQQMPQQDPEPDKAEDEAAWFEWKINQVEQEKNVIKNYLLHDAHQRQRAAQYHQAQQQQQQASENFVGALSRHEQEWDRQRPGYYDRTQAVVDFLTQVEIRSGGSPQQVEQRIQQELYGMLYRAQAEGRPPAAVVESIYETMQDVMGGGAQASGTPPASPPSAPNAFEQAQRAQQDGAAGSMGSAGGGLSESLMTPDHMRTGDFSNRDATQALDKMGTEDYLELIRRAGS